MIDVKIAAPEDAKDFLSVYGPYIEEGNVSFEYTVPSVTEFEGRIRHILEKYPYLKLVSNGACAGYAYASPLRERRAYDWSAETTIYLSEAYQRKGYGSMLYEALFGILRMQGIANAVALIYHPYEVSEGFHRRIGFEQVGLLEKCAFKNGEWLDLAYYQKRLIDPLEPHPDFPVPFPELPRRKVEEVLKRVAASRNI